MKKTRDFNLVLQEMLADDPRLAELVEEEAFWADVGQQIYDARKQAGLSQVGLAELLGTSQSTVARLESADYDGHSITTLRRIAKALGKRLHVEFCAPRSYQAPPDETTSMFQVPDVTWNNEQWAVDVQVSEIVEAVG